MADLYIWFAAFISRFLFLMAEAYIMSLLVESDVLLLFRWGKNGHTREHRGNFSPRTQKKKFIMAFKTKHKNGNSCLPLLWNKPMMFAKGLLDSCKRSWHASAIIAFPAHKIATPTNSNNSLISQEHDRRADEGDLEEEPEQGPTPQRPTSPEAGSDEGASQSSQRADLSSAEARSEQGHGAAEAQPNAPGFDQQPRRHGGGGRPCDRARVPGIYRQFLGGSSRNCAPCVECLGFRCRQGIRLCEPGQCSHQDSSTQATGEEEDCFAVNDDFRNRQARFGNRGCIFCGRREWTRVLYPCHNIAVCRPCSATFRRCPVCALRLFHPF